MNLIQSILIYAGGPGSGCNPRAGKCGRPSTGTIPAHGLRHGSVIHRVFQHLQDQQWHPISELEQRWGQKVSIVGRLSVLNMYGNRNGQWRIQSSGRGSNRRIRMVFTNQTAPSTSTVRQSPPPVNNNVVNGRSGARNWLIEHGFDQLKNMGSNTWNRTDPTRPGIEVHYDDYSWRIRQNNKEVASGNYNQNDRMASWLNAHPGTSAPSSTVSQPAQAPAQSNPEPWRQPKGFLAKPVPEVTNTGPLIGKGIYINETDYKNFAQKFKMSPEDYKTKLLSGLPESFKNGIRMRVYSEDSNTWNVDLSGNGMEQERTFNFTTGTVSHNFWRLPDNLQGQGIGKTIFKNQLDLYDHLGMEKVRVHAGLSAGGYAWARFGFVPDQSSWDNLRTNLKRKISNVSDPGLKARLNLITDIRDPKAIWLLAAQKDKEGGVGEEIGKRLLAGTGWGGTLSLKNKENYEVLKSYVGRSVRAAVSNNYDYSDILSSPEGQMASDLLAYNFARKIGWSQKQALSLIGSSALREYVSGGNTMQAGGSGSGCHGPNCGRPRSSGGRSEPHGPHMKNMGMKKIKSSKISDFVYKFIKKNHGNYDLGKWSEDCTEDDDSLEASANCGQLRALYRTVGLKMTAAEHLVDAIQEWTGEPTKALANAAQKVLTGKIGGDKLAKALAVENGIARAKLKDKDITLYRGIDDKYAVNILNQALRNGHNNFTIKTRGADSWTDDPSEAEDFGPIMLKIKVPAKYVMSSHRSNDILRDMDENEFIVAFPKGKVKITSKNVSYKGDFYAASEKEEEPIEIDLTNDNWLRNKRKKRIKAGGQGSGCHGDNCGRPPGKDALGKNEHVVRYYGMNRRRLADGNVGYEKLLNPSKMVRVEFPGGSNWHVLIGKKEGPNWNWKVTGKGSDYYDLRSTLDQTFKERESPPQQERQLNYPKMQESLKKHKAKLEDDAKYEEIVKKPWSKQTEEERHYVAQRNKNQLKLPLDAVGFDMVQLKRPKMPKLGHKPNPSEGHGSFGKSGHFKTSPTKLRADAGVRFQNPHGPITFKNPHGPITFKNPHGAFKVPGSHGGYKIPNPSESGGSGKMGHNNPNPSLKADAEGEPMVGNMSHAHIEPITWFQPPSGKLKKPVPADDPTNRDDDTYLDVTKRKAKSTQNQRMNILKTQVPGGNPPMIPVRTTAMEPQSGVFQPLYAAKKRIKTRPAKIMGAKATRIYLPR